MIRLFKIIFSKNNIDPIGSNVKNVTLFGSLFLALVSAILTGLNIYKHYWFMTGSTLLLLVGFGVAALFAAADKITVSRFISAAMCGLIFSVYALIGGNDGFAILWILLVPLVSSLLVGLQIGFCLSLYFQLFLIALFYTPLSQLVRDYYTDTFIMRFPALYFASFGSVTFLMCHRQSLFNDVHRQANIDLLTGLYNRNHYMEIMALADDPVKNPTLTLLSMDLNGLKQANDTMGHEAGDELICGAAGLVLQAFPKDLCFRTGGDEFTVVCRRSHTEAEVQKLQDAVAAWHGKLVDSMYISVGVASREQHPALSFEELSRLADEDMYRRKAEFYRTSGIDRRAPRSAG